MTDRIKTAKDELERELNRWHAMVNDNGSLCTIREDFIKLKELVLSTIRQEVDHAYSLNDHMAKACRRHWEELQAERKQNAALKEKLEKAKAAMVDAINTLPNSWGAVPRLQETLKEIEGGE